MELSNLRGLEFKHSKRNGSKFNTVFEDPEHFVGCEITDEDKIYLEAQGNYVYVAAKAVKTFRCHLNRQTFEWDYAENLGFKWPIFEVTLKGYNHFLKKCVEYDSVDFVKRLK